MGLLGLKNVEFVMVLKPISKRTVKIITEEKL